MTDDHQCAQIRQELGVYLLGTIEPARRAVMARHLATCPECRAELAGLAGLPALLGRVPADELRRLLEGDVITPVPGPPAAALLGRMARVRRRRRYLAAAAALIVGVAAVSGWQALRPSGPAGAGAQPRWEATDEAVNPVTGAGAAVRYAAEPWGTELEVRVSGVAAGTRCQFWVTGPRGQRVDAGGWIIVAGQQAAWHPASVPFRVSMLRSFQVTGDGKILVTVEDS
jgi:anti-sigma factor RsiW